ARQEIEQRTRLAAHALGVAQVAGVVPGDRRECPELARGPQSARQPAELWLAREQLREVQRARGERRRARVPGIGGLEELRQLLQVCAAAGAVRDQSARLPG